MKLAVLSHSNINLRQQLFWKEFSKFAEVLVVSPREWNGQIAINDKDGNYELFTSDVENKGNMRFYYFHGDAFKKVSNFNPDIIFHQGEFYTTMCDLSQQLAKTLRCKFVNFCWDNINLPDKKSLKLIKKTDLNICGNEDCKKLYHGDIVLPQVGINVEDFKSGKDKEFDVIYVGREDKTKGIEYIKWAYPDTKFFHNIQYAEVPEIMGKSKILVNFPYDTNFWKEQFAPFSVIEAMSCGCVIITSNTSSVSEWLKDSPAIFVPMHNKEKLRDEIRNLLVNEKRLKKLSEQSIEFAKRFDNKVVAENLYKNLKVI
ncbi:MAG: glycosyltransferase [archaeon]|nr:glycosyltransferase [archaeon]